MTVSREANPLRLRGFIYTSADWPSEGTACSVAPWKVSLKGHKQLFHFEEYNPFNPSLLFLFPLMFQPAVS